MVSGRKPCVFLHNIDRSKAVLLCLLVLVTVSVFFSPSVCLDDIKLGLGS